MYFYVLYGYLKRDTFLLCVCQFNKQHISRPCLRRLITGLSSKSPQFDPRSVCVRFVVEELALRQVFLKVLPSYPNNNQLLLPAVQHTEICVPSRNRALSDILEISTETKFQVSFSALPWYSAYLHAQTAAGLRGRLQGNWRSCSWCCIVLRCAVCGVWCAVCGVRCAVCGVRCALCGVRCLSEQYMNVTYISWNGLGLSALFIIF
jgi:hypothetical protein